MGLFDEILCKFPLPAGYATNNITYQTKDTPAQFCDLYEIREDGSLWHQAYDTEDQSGLGKWRKENKGKEPDKKMLNDFHQCLFGCMTRINKRWEQESSFTGEIRFYSSITSGSNGWIEWSAYFVDGKTNQIKLIESKEPE